MGISAPRRECPLPNRARFAVLPTLVLALASVVGCGGSTKDGAGGSATADAFCSAFFGAWVDREAACLPESSRNGWTRLLDPTLPCARLADAVAAKRVAYDPAQGAACLAELKTLACDAAQDPLLHGACGKAVVPQVPTGGPCKSFYLFAFNECTAGACDQGGPTSCAGTCTAFVPQGQPCEPPSGPRCEPGASCTSGTKLCSPEAAIGAPCEGPDAGHCGSGLYCANATSSKAGVCVARATSGPCAGTDACATGYLCLGASGAKTCARPKSLGDACTPGARECALFSVCGSDMKCQNGLLSTGQACDATAGEAPACLTGYCDRSGGAGVCAPQKTAGQSCTGTPAFGECAGDNAYCDSGTMTCQACSP